MSQTTKAELEAIMNMYRQGRYDECLKEIKSKCLNSDDAQYLHYGVTSQDAIDTARNLQIYRFLSYLEKRLDELLIYAANQSNSFKNLLIVASTR